MVLATSSEQRTRGHARTIREGLAVTTLGRQLSVPGVFARGGVSRPEVI
ncbi:MAG: hypothetical protein QOK42_2867 [Frankiaceae bacterium]|jgi:hypothetical protein|nr:hypothetical protein [Frankiaceae bacterium]MDX6226400.1 hypothetical protein [Frankiales bacterium]